MYKVSEVISKPIYAIYEGIKMGTVVNFLYDNRYKKIKGFFIFDDESDSEHYVPSRNVYKIGSDNLLIKNRNKVQLTKFDKNILNLNLISVNGEDAGNIKDLFFDEKFKVNAIETKRGVIVPINTLINIGQDIAIFDISDQKINIARMKPLSKILIENIPNIKVNILEESKLATIPIISNNLTENDFLTERTKQEIKPEQKKSVVLPPKILSNPKSIIGKYAKDFLYGLNGEIIVKKGQLITEIIYKKAQKHSKLFELTNNIN